MSQIKTALHYPIDISNIPSNWTTGYVKDFTVELQPGFACGVHNKDGVGIPHIRPMNVDRVGNLDFTTVKHISPNKDSKRLKAGDVLFNNTNSPELIGKTTIIMKPYDWGFSNHMTRIVFSNNINPKFAAYQLHYLWMTGYFLHNCIKHVNQASISTKALAKSVPFIAAPIAQQDSIVAEIEKQFSRLDQAVESLKRVKANLKRYKAAVLKAAVEGKLTEAWRKAHPDVEPADKLLQSILAKRRKCWEENELAKMKAKGKMPKDDKWKRKYKEPQAPEKNGLDGLPKKWQWCTLGQLLYSIKAGKSFKCEERPPFGNEVGVVKVSAVSWGEFNELESKTVTDVSKVKQDYIIHHDDFLFSRANTIDLVGACVIVKIFKRKLMLSDKILRFDFAHDLHKWCLICLRSHLGRNEIESLATGNQDSMRNISQANIFRIRMPLPPQSEQQLIVQEVENNITNIQNMEKEVEKNLIRADRLRQSILKKAFSGRLLKDTSDETLELPDLPLAAEPDPSYRTAQ